MNKKFKKVISSVLAAVMTLGVVGVANVSSVFAGENTNTYYYVHSPNVNTQKNSQNYFTCGMSDTKAGTFLTSAFSFTDETTTYTPTQAAKAESTTKITFTSSGTSTVEVVWSARSDRTNKTAKIKLDSTTANEVYNSGDTVSYLHSTFTDITAGSHTIATASDQPLIYGIKVTEVTGDDSKDYTLSGTSNLKSGDTFVLDSDTVTVGENGAWSLIKNATTSPFTEGATLAVSKAQYNASPDNVTITKVSDTTYSASNIEFTLKDLEALKEGTYSAADIAAGRPNFIIDSGNVSGTQVKLKDKGYFEFILNKNATVTFSYKCGSSSNSTDDNGITSDKKATPSLVNANGEVITTGETVTVDDNQKTFTANNLPAGTYRIVCSSPSSYQDDNGNTIPSGSTCQVDNGGLVVSYGSDVESAFNNANVVEKNGTLYIYAEISADDVANENITSVGIANGNKVEKMSTREVAKSVKDGDDVIVAAADGKYYAAVKVTKSDSDSETLNIVPFTVVSGETVYGDVITYPAAN